MKANLCLHTGGETVSIEDIRKARTPAASGIWQPIGHEELIIEIESGLESAGLQIVNRSHALAKEGDRYFGLYQIEQKDFRGRDYALVMGLRNSHDKTFPAGITVGSQVFVCDNLAFSGEIVLGRRHTTNIRRDLPGKVAEAIGLLVDQWQGQDKRFQAYKEKALSNAEAHDIMIQAFKAGAIPLTKLSNAIQEWYVPSYEEFSNHNVWRLYNAFTEALKGNMNMLAHRTRSLHGILDSHCGLVCKE